MRRFTALFAVALLALCVGGCDKKGSDKKTAAKKVKKAPKADEAKKDAPKKDEPKADEVKKDEPKTDEVKKDEPKADETKKDEPKADETKKDEPKADEAKKDEPGPDTSAEATALLDKAIAAAGGLDVLKAKLAATTIESEGTYMGGPYKMVTYWKAPGQMVMNIDAGAMTMGYLGDVCWSSYGEVVVDCPEEEKKQSDEMMSGTAAVNLYPLKAEGVKLETVADAEVDGKPAVGIKASGGPVVVPVTLHFDKESSLLVKSSWHGHWGTQKGDIVYAFSDHKEVDGVKVPGATKMTLDGKLIIDEKVVEVKLGEADEAAMKRPEQAPMSKPKVRKVEAQTVAFTVAKGPYMKLGQAVGGLYQYATKSGLGIMSGTEMLFIKGPNATKDPEEYVTELRVAVVIPGDPPAKDGDFETKKVDAIEIAVQLEQGPPQAVAQNYEGLAKWAEENGYKIVGPASMLSYSNPMSTPPEKMLSEIYFPVAKK